MNPTDLQRLLSSLTQRGLLIELGTLAACLGAAWLITWLLRRRSASAQSVWLGDHIVDGVLFPLLALAGVFAARWGLQAGMVLPRPALLQLAVPILASLLIIRLGVRVLEVAFPKSQLVRVAERTLSWVVWIGLVLWLTGALPLLLGEMEQIHWKVGGGNVTLRSLVEGSLSAVLVLVLMLWLSAAIETRLLSGAGEPGFGGNLSLRKIAANATRALLLLVGLLLALSAAGIPLGALSVFGGALGVGIGFGLQKLASNYVSGFVILAERSLRIGDVVKVDNFEGRITDINTRFTVVRALNGRESIVPNELLITQRVENLTLSDPRVVLTSTVQVPYGTDIDWLIPRLVEVVREVPRVLADPAPAVLLSSFAADGLELTVSYWIGDPENGLGGARSDVNRALLRELDRQHIGIPFPQRVVQVQAAPGAEAAAQLLQGTPPAPALQPPQATPAAQPPSSPVPATAPQPPGVPS
ncbi:mechanosensitive ion channel family protein [Azohydromonas caseinilytica]|uniref:Mechanosensitive ion channel n=1 Tax=Azohydromonas caseinilytica TaxID=2728836 RepID=A0A848FF79_9BURK|nr:mechanosensitive ion channel domain-containing protein [Azohydromonas caseinilytica]NML17495.1 mechanosensitive ion channel [Azohydromonas caseinilytica]